MSGVVMSFSHRKSPHGCHSPVSHVLEERPMMPISMSLANSAFALASFSGDKQRTLVDIGLHRLVQISPGAQS